MEKVIKNILITQDYCVLDGVGTSPNTLELAKGLANKGFNVGVCSPKSKENVVVGGVKILGFESLDDLGSKILQYDLVIAIVNFSITYKPMVTGVFSICNKLNTPYISWVRTTLRNSYLNNIAGRNDFTQEVTNNYLIQNLESKNCKKIICNSTSVKKSLINLGIRPSKICVIYNAINPLNKAFATAGYDTKKLHDVIFTGRLSPEKGVIYFLSAVKVLAETQSNVKALLIGDGPDKAVVRSWIKLLDITNNVELIPKLENGKLIQKIKQSKVYVNSSFTESFGNTIIEAMAAGVPVVVPNLEGPLEIVQNGKFGDIFNLGDTKNLADKIACNFSTSLEKLKQIRKMVLNKFSIQNQIDGFLHIIQQCEYLP